jgi:hypothetical protein
LSFLSSFLILPLVLPRPARSPFSLVLPHPSSSSFLTLFVFPFPSSPILLHPPSSSTKIGLVT